MSIDAAIVSTANFLKSVMPWIPQNNVVRGQSNDVPAPLSPMIVITEILQAQYTTTRTKLNSSGNATTFTMPRRLDLQIDCYGKRAGEMSVIASTLLRSYAATEFFPEGYEPLYCSDPIQAPLITGEKQFETRWTLTFSMQYNNAIVLPTESFNTVGETEAIPADIINPVE
jgi:hypothetical protein